MIYGIDRCIRTTTQINFFFLWAASKVTDLFG